MEEDEQYSRDVRVVERPDHMEVEGSTLGLYSLESDAGAINIINPKLM